MTDESRFAGGGESMPLTEALASGGGNPRAPGRPPVADEEKHKSVGISMSPVAADTLKEMAKASGLSQGALITELLRSRVLHPGVQLPETSTKYPWRHRGDAAPTASANLAAAILGAISGTSEQRSLALALTQSAISSWERQASEDASDRAEAVVALYEAVLAAIVARRISG